jgi:hypothetical protein
MLLTWFALQNSTFMKQRLTIFYLLFQSTLPLFGQNKQAYLDQYFSILEKNQQSRQYPDS